MVGPTNHFLLGIGNQGLKQLADKIGAAHFLDDGLKWRDNFMSALSNPNTKFSVNLDGFSGENVAEMINKAVQRGVGLGLYGSATEWEMGQLKLADRLKDVIFYLAGKIVDNPYK